MKKALHKITLREIWYSRGRFLSILCIVMLGAGFLSGLKVTTTAMLETLDDFSSENSFYDYRIVSTLGTTDDDVEAFLKMECVEKAEGSIAADAVFTMPDGSDAVIKVYSMAYDVNTPILRSGRMPENPAECVVDSTYMQNVELGSVLTLTKTDDVSSDMFAYKEYTVVGLVNSPLYINFSRGTTSLGSGSVSGFMFVGDGGLYSDYYTDIYLRLTDTGAVYSEEYDDAVDAYKDDVTEMAESRGDTRYGQIISDATDEYNDGLAEYEDGLSKYTTEKIQADLEFSDALAEIESSEQKIASSRAELDDGWAQLSDAKSQLAEARAEYEAEASSAQEELNAAKRQIDAGRAQYESALAQYQDGEAQYIAGLEQYQRGEELYEAALEEYNAAVAMYGQAALADKKAELDNTRTQLDALNTHLTEAKSQLDNTKTQLEVAAESLDDAQVEYDKGLKKLADAKEQLDDATADISKSEQTLIDGEAQYSSGLESLMQGRAEYEIAKAEADEKFAEVKDELDDAKTKLDDAKSEINAIKRPTVYALNRYTNTGYASFESDSSIVDGVARVFPVFFFLVAALVCVTTMNRMVDEQHSQIGTLKSLGYNSWEIMRGFLLYSGLASGIGSILGVCLGSIVFPKLIWRAYNMMYDFAEIKFVFDWGHSAFVCFAFVFLALFVTWLSCRRELAVAPAELIRPRSPKPGKRILLERIHFIWNRFSFLQKVSARNVFRYKKRMFMMIIGISGCTALLLTAFGLNNSITGLANTQFNTISIYDAQVNFQEAMSELDQEHFIKERGEKITDCVFLSVSSADALKENSTKSVNLIGSDEPDMTPFMNFELNGEVQSFPGTGEVLINDGLANSLDIDIGDRITLRNLDMNELELTVSGIYHNIIYNFAYVSLDTLKNAEGFNSDVNSAYINFPDGADPYASAASMGTSKYVTSTTVNEETLTLVNQSMDSMKYIVGVIILCAGALAFIVLYNLTSININERVREIATIKVLGFRRWETASYVYRENLVLTIIGALIGIPLGIWLHKYVMSNIRIDMITFDVHINPLSYFLSFAMTMLFAAIVNFFMYFRLDKIDMVESLKSVE